MRRVNVYGREVAICDSAINDYVYNTCEKRKWKPELYEVLNRFLTPEMTFVDVGAYVGSVSLYAAFTAKRVVAVEPDPVTERVLSENIRLNPELSPKITVRELALSHQRGTAEFGGRGGFGSSVCGLNFAGECPEHCLVRTVTLAEFLKAEDVEDPFFLKMNAQGSEGRILHAAQGFLREHRPVLHIYIRPINWRGPKDYETLIDALKSYDHVYTETGARFNPDEIGLQWRLDVKDYKLLALPAAWDSVTSQ